ncbi:MAG TPA: patatin-like phospholipase family protein [Burkholderiaceae bacterium]|nr:patatin-like phospholipase family protein [Burkholderiaceae bacterium]
MLTGGGARAAYQAGVLDALREILADHGWPAGRNPFPVICGTSAGAVNAAALAAGCDDFAAAIERLVSLWSEITPAQIYRVDAVGALRNASHWLGALTLGWMIRSRPRSLFDNAPLAELIERSIAFGRIAELQRAGHLNALSLAVSSYTSGQHVTYFQSRDPVEPWFRTQRLACRTELDAMHVLASAAIPFVFPAVPLAMNGRREYFGDGSMREVAPLSPAIHLGADRIVVIGSGAMQLGTVHSAHTGSQYLYPSLAQIASHALASIFLDGLTSDIERLTRINRTLTLIPGYKRDRSLLRPIELLVILPSRRLDAMAGPHVRSLPWTTRSMLRLIGATDRRGTGLASYLLFEPGYTRQLIELGRADAFARIAEIRRFFRLDSPDHASRRDSADRSSRVSTRAIAGAQNCASESAGTQR